MPIIDQIEKARSLPAVKRHQIAFGLSLSISVIIFIVWASTLHLRISDITESNAGDVKSIATPFEAIGETISDTYGDVKQGFNEFLSQEATSGLTH